MTFDNYRDACRSLRARSRGATDEQKEMAKSLGVRLPRSSPELVAGQILREALSGVLAEERSPAPTFGQGEYLDDLVDSLGTKNVKPQTKLQASAWIEVLERRRAIQALTTLELRRGDIVRAFGIDEPAELVNSIGLDGRVHFAGGRGRQERPHRLEVLARVGDESDEAVELRDELSETMARRESTFGPPTGRRLLALAEFRVDDRAGRTEAELLQRELDSAKDERPMQKFLAKHPSCLSALVRSTYGTFVLPLPRLGSEYVPDFAIASADSIGIHWTLVELESPTAKVSLNGGEPAAQLRTAIGQITDWRDWLSENLDYARKSRADNGLGLVGITSDAAGLILIGAGEERSARFERFRRRAIPEQGLTIHTYSWLVRTLKTYSDPLLGPLEMDAANF